MITLASFPRSGNTFFRNVLYEVYGIESSTFHRDPDRKIDHAYNEYKAVKTHLLPSNLPAKLRNRPAVYLIRDGRDSLVSIAHHRKDIVVPGSDFYTNLIEAILAQKGSFFGGWSRNVREWTTHADIVIRFTDLIEDPIREVEKLRAIMDLPTPNLEKLPTFKQLKFGTPRYGGGKKRQPNGKQQKHFRRGKAGGWKDELSPELEKLLWNIHGPELLKQGYEPPRFSEQRKLKHVMIESSKLYSQDNDGVTRYQAELVNGLRILLPHLPEWKIDLYDRKSVQPLGDNPPGQEATKETEFKATDKRVVVLHDRRTMGYEKVFLLLKDGVSRWMPVKVYDVLSDHYRKGPYRTFLKRFALLARRWKYKKGEAEVFAEVAKADLVHLPLPQHYDKVDENAPPVLVTVHDLTHRIFPEFHIAENYEASEKGMQVMVNRQAHFLAVSQSTKNDLAKYYQLPDERLHMVHEAANLSLFRPLDRNEDTTWFRRKYNIPPGRYLMCLSVVEPRKNLQNTIRAFLQLKNENPELTTKLVICGKHGWKTKEVFAGIDLNHPDLIFTGFVEDAHLPFLYAHAQALCYLSFYEGFGLPVLEAMACKTPVIYGNNSSLPEVAGKGGLPVDTDDITGIVNAMHVLLTDEKYWLEKADAAYRQASKFSWLKTALETLEVYDKVISQ